MLCECFELVRGFFIYFEAKLENKFFNSLKGMFLGKISIASSGSALSYVLITRIQFLSKKKFKMI